MSTILVVDDEQTYRETLTFKFKRDGYDVVTAADGAQAIDVFNEKNPDVVLLDLMLPGFGGEEVCRRIRAHSNVPIIMLTAKDDEIDKIVGLEVGADDYVTKPYSYRELLARVRAVLRRSKRDVAEKDYEDILEVGSVRMNCTKHEVSVNDEPISMPLREFELLELFMRNSGRVLTRGQILDRIWGADYIGDTKTLDVHVKRIRSKIEEDPKEPQLVVTVRGLGYKMSDE